MLISRSTRLAHWTAVAATAIGTIVLIGWIAHIPVLKHVIPTFVTMKFNTAFCIALSGSALLIRRRSNGRFAKAANIVMTGLVIVITAGTLAEYAAHRNIGIDELFMRDDPGPGTAPPGRPAPNTATGLLTVGLAIALDHRRTRGLAIALATVAAIISGVGFVGYLYAVQSLYASGQTTAMALHTTTSLMMLAVSLLAGRPEHGYVAFFLSGGPGGRMARRLIPAAIVMDLILGWLRIKGQYLGLYGTLFGVAILIIANIIILTLLILLTSRSTDRSEGARVEAHRSLIAEVNVRRQAEVKLQAQLGRLNLLQQITRAIGERQDLRSILQVVVRRVEDDLPVDFSCICDYDPASQSLDVVGAGVKSEALALDLAMPEHARLPIDENGMARCIRGQLIYEPDIIESQLPFPNRLAGRGLRSLVMAPLILENKVFGILVAARRVAEGFSSGECEFLRQLSEHTALAMHHAQMYSALERAYDDLRQTQQAVMQQERLRALGQMASGIAHDINNAMSPVSLYTDLLQREQNLGARARGYLDTIHRAVSDIKHTVARLTEFYREREPQLKLSPILVNRLLQQVADLTRARWSDMPLQRGVVIRVRTQLATDPSLILGVESEIREALINLVFNAVDAMPEGGTLTLRTTEQTLDSPGMPRLLQVHIEVADTGIGMDEDTRRRCLEPFFTTKGERGTGLGLAMVYGIAKRHNALFEIDTARSQGTTMRLIFTVPAAAVPDALPKEQAKPSPQRILLIDDDPLVLSALRDTLEADGHIVTTANGGQHGIDIFRAERPRSERFSIVITDLGMPYVGGREVAGAVKETSPSTPVILLTGWGQRLLAEEALPSHVDCVLSKPPTLEQLRAALAQFVAGSTD